MATIDMELRVINPEIDIEVKDLLTPVDMEIEMTGGAWPTYDGSYNVVPRKHAQVLETKNKSLVRNIEIYPIHASAVSNPAGGTTVNIGFE